MELTSTTHLSLDGVYQGPGGPTEDTSGGFDRGGWTAQFADEQGGTFISEVFERADAFLFGRRTYEIFSAYWPNYTDPEFLIARKFNDLPKYVASGTLKDPGWNNTRVLDGNLVQAIRELKALPGGELQVWGSGILLRFLIEHELLDRMNLIVYPVIVGKGKRLFPESGPDVRLALQESRTTPSGETISVYRPDGRPEYARADE